MDLHDITHGPSEDRRMPIDLLTSSQSPHCLPEDSQSLQSLNDCSRTPHSSADGPQATCSSLDQPESPLDNSNTAQIPDGLSENRVMTIYNPYNVLRLLHVSANSQTIRELQPRIQVTCINSTFHLRTS